MAETTRLSAMTRFRAAVALLRDAAPLPTLGVKDRRAYAERLQNEQWFRRNFYRTSRPLWKGSAIDVLWCLSMYCTPRATWAQLRSKGDGWYRREQAWTFLLFVQHKLGEDAAKVLRDAYATYGVKYRPRRPGQKPAKPFQKKQMSVQGQKLTRANAALREFSKGEVDPDPEPLDLGRNIDVVAFRPPGDPDRAGFGRQIQQARERLASEALRVLRPAPSPRPDIPQSKRRRITFDD